MSSIEVKLAQIHALLGTGKHAQARPLAQRLVQIAPADADVNSVMSHVLAGLDQHSQAVFFAERAIGAAPGRADLRHSLAFFLLTLGRREEALVQVQKAVELAPAVNAHRALLVTTLSTLGRYAEAADACMIDPASLPTDKDLLTAAASSMLISARPEAAMELYERAAALFPSDGAVASNLCSATMYVPGLDRAQVAEIHRRYGRLVEPSPPRAPPLPQNPDPQRKLRVGLVSPDMHGCPVAQFILPLLVHADPDRVEFVVYDTAWANHADAMTEKLRARVSQWREIGTTSWESFASKIRADGVDILIELTGHMQWHSLPLMAFRPAPIQISYLGYPHSTGLSSIDYRIVDSHTDPAPWSDEFASEKLIRLDPCFICFSALGHPPEVTEPPHVRAGRITFGSFNTAQKINRPLSALWARVLRATPESQLLLKAVNFKDRRLADRVTEMLVDEGIGADRVRILGPEEKPADHLNRYGEMDIALDTFPYHGTTTTCEALIMGVPVVTLAGDRHASRVGVSLLNNVGLGECIAASEDEYVDKATALAADSTKLARLRTEVRTRFLSSPICDGAGFASRFEGTLRKLWVARCDDAKSWT